MRMELTVVGMKDSEALHTFVSTHLSTLKRRLDNPRYKGGKFELRVRPEGHKTTGGTKSFEIEVIFSLPHTRTLVIRKKAKVAQVGVSEAIHAAEVQILRLTEKANASRKNSKTARKIKRAQPEELD